MLYVEANFDGLVGPTHNHSGLSFGNIASSQHKSQIASPKQAALQGLAKMKTLADMGFIQGVLPPQERPDMATLRSLGFSGTDGDVIQQANAKWPEVLAACCSASSMWAANAATVSPSADSLDGRVHFTPANLFSHPHRCIEASTTSRILKTCFADESCFFHHPPLASFDWFSDEGAANHSRLETSTGEQGIELFVYGRSAFAESCQPMPSSQYPSRQTLEACQAIALSHLLDPERVVFAQQNPAVIDKGVFHNDVIGVCHQNLLFCHQQAYVDQQQLYTTLNTKLNGDLQVIEVSNEQLSVEEAVSSYLFNSQLLTLPNNDMMLLLPKECEENPKVSAYLSTLVRDNNPIRKLQFMDLKQSMRNGGGPACLRLRVLLNENELQAVNPAIMMNDELYKKLIDWVTRHYRDHISPEDLADPSLIIEGRYALDELTYLLDLGSIYPFQQC